ncbi:MAG TPA: RDD family protein [Candidatus Dormibacteraeota bacterium]|nr:RDD family protein [Candidatus Dormibacteraeota bacterium]
MVQGDELVPAGFGRRLAAASIDTVLLAVLALVVASVVVVVAAVVSAVAGLPESAVTGGELLLAMLVVLVILAWLYSTLLHAAPWQATIGKLLLGLSVTDRQGRRISFPRATLRHAASIAVYLTLSVGFLVILVPGSRQALHDLLAGTLVVRRRRAQALVPPYAAPAPVMALPDRPAPVVALPDRAQPAVVGSPDGRWWWDGQQWQPAAGSARAAPAPVRIRPRVSPWRRAAAIAAAVPFFGGGLLLVALDMAGATDTTAFTAALIATGVGMLGALAMAPALAGRRQRAWDEAMATAFERTREDGEGIEASTYAYIGPRPWVLNLLLAEWIVRLVLPQGCLVVTNRRLLLFHVAVLRSTLDRLDRVEDIARVHVRTFSPGLIRPRIVLAVETRPQLQVTLPWSWAGRANAVVAAVDRLGAPKPAPALPRR